MANKLYFSKVTLPGGGTYYIKDAEAQEVLRDLLGLTSEQDLPTDASPLGSAAYKNADTVVTGEAQGVPTTAAVKDYVDSQIETIPSFDVVIDDLGSDGEPATDASADTFHKIYLVDASSPAQPNLYKEWITIRSGKDPNYTYSWELIGDTSMNLSTYLQNTASVAGVEFGQDKAISADELKTALGLKALAYKDSASTNYTPAGTISVEAEPSKSTATATFTGTYTPSGSITGSAIKGGSISVTLADTLTAATWTKEAYTPEGSVSVTLSTGTTSVLNSITKSAEGSFQPEGSIAGTSISVTYGSAQTVVTEVGEFNAGNVGFGSFDGGSQASFTSTYRAPSMGNATTGKFATQVLQAVGGADETLVFSYTASEPLGSEGGVFDDAVTEQGTLNAGTFTATFTPNNVATWTGATYTAPSLGDASTATVPVVTGATVTAEPTFTGEKYALGTANVINAASVASASFEGTQVADMKVSAIQYNKPGVDTATFNPEAATLGFDGTAATISVEGDVEKVDAINVTTATFAGTAATITVQ